VNLQLETIMFKPNLLVSLTVGIALLGASSAFAQEATVAPEFQNFVSTKTRAEVIAETRAALRQGLIALNDADAARIAERGFRSVKTRAQVRAETREAIRLGLVQYGEASSLQPTPEQLDAVRMAGLRELESTNVIASN
jgi:Domain of unknown function (DUF4148)